MEETNKEPPNFTIGFKDDLAVFQASKSNEIESNESPLVGTLRSIL